jgi:hypothetical protein
VGRPSSLPSDYNPTGSPPPHNPPPPTPVQSYLHCGYLETTFPCVISGINHPRFDLKCAGQTHNQEDGWKRVLGRKREVGRSSMKKVIIRASIPPQSSALLHHVTPVYTPKDNPSLHCAHLSHFQLLIGDHALPCDSHQLHHLVPPL